MYHGLISQGHDTGGIAGFSASAAIPLMGLHSNASPNTLKKAPHMAYTEHLLSEGFAYILSHSNIKKVVLSHHPRVSWYNVVDTYHPDNKNFDRILHDGFARTYEALTKAGKEIYVILDNPDFGVENWSKCKASVVRRPVAVPAFLNLKNEKACSLKKSDRLDRRAVDNWNKVAHETAAGYKNIHFIDLERLFCPNGICSMLDSKGNLLYRDGDHLNVNGSLFVAPFILDMLM